MVSVILPFSCAIDDLVLDKLYRQAWLANNEFITE